MKTIKQILSPTYPKVNVPRECECEWCATRPRHPLSIPRCNRLGPRYTGKSAESK